MSEQGQRILTVLDGCAQFLGDKAIVLSKHQPCLVLWGREYAGSAVDYTGYTFEQTLDLYLAEVGRRVDIKPWQVQQTADAVRIYRMARRSDAATPAG